MLPLLLLALPQLFELGRHDSFVDEGLQEIRDPVHGPRHDFDLLKTEIGRGKKAPRMPETAKRSKNVPSGRAKSASTTPKLALISEQNLDRCSATDDYVSLE